MMYEHLKLDLSAECVEYLGKLFAHVNEHPPQDVSERVRIELKNLENECRARIQHVLAGMPDVSVGAAVPGRSAKGDWLDE